MSKQDADGRDQSRLFGRRRVNKQSPSWASLLNLIAIGPGIEMPVGNAISAVGLDMRAASYKYHFSNPE